MATTVKKSGAKKSPAKKSGGKRAVKKTTSQKTASKKTASKKSASKKTSSKKAAAEKSALKKVASKKTASKNASRKTPVKKWSGKVTETSDAMDLRENIFKSSDPKKIARSLKTSSEKSHRKKGTPFQSAMSMLNFYINRGGKNLSASKKKVLEKTKNELRDLFGREEE